MRQPIFSALGSNFLGNAPDWYKYSILAFLVINPVMIAVAGMYVTGWLLIIEFIFTLAMALKCYPLQPGGLLVLEATGWFGYGSKLPAEVRAILTDYSVLETQKRGTKDRVALTVQALVAIVLVLGLAFHIAAVGLVGLMVIVLLTSALAPLIRLSYGRMVLMALPYTVVLSGVGMLSIRFLS